MDTSQYLDIFVDETKEHIQVLSDQIMVLEKEPDNSDEPWDLRECNVLHMIWKMYSQQSVKGR